MMSSKKGNYLAYILILLIGLVCLLIAYRIFNKGTASLADFPWTDAMPDLEFQFAIGGETATGDYTLSEPMAVDIAGNGNIFVADTANNLIKVFNEKGDLKYSFGDKELFYLPVDLAIAGERVLVADSKNARIQMFDLKGKFIKTLISQDIGKKIGAWIPVAIDIADNGDLYITDVFYNRVTVFDKDGRFLRQIGKAGSGEGEFLYPNGIVVDSARNGLFISDSNNGRIQVFDLKGKFKGVLQKNGQPFSLNMPRGLALDKEGVLFVTESFSHQLSLIRIDGYNITDLVSVGGRGVGDNQMNFPNDVAVNNEIVCIADRANDRVLVYKIK